MSIPQVEDAEGGPRIWPHTDPAIKLFGKDIPVSALSSNDLHHNGPHLIPAKAMAPSPSEQRINHRELPSIVKAEENMEKDVHEPMATSSGCDDLDGAGSSQGLSSAPTSMDTSVAKGDDTPNHGKILKKPDKLLPCPRCESLDTKFCYFNNYNVNQPRHFCRKCQRYWTAGGMLRNVPVGAGRRKNKHSSSHSKNMAGAHSDAMTVRSDLSDVARHRSSTSSNVQENNHQLNLLYPGHRVPVHLHPLETCNTKTLDSPSPKTSLLNFGQESPLCRSMAATTIGMQNPKNDDEPMETKHLLAHEIPVSKNISMSVPNSGTNNGSSGNITVPLGGFPAGSSMPTHPILCKQTDTETASSTDPQTRSSSVPNCAGPWQFNGSIPWSTEGGAFPIQPPSFVPCNGSIGVPTGLWPSFPWPLMNPAMWGAPSPLGWANSWPAAMPWGSAAAVAVAGLGGVAQPVKPQIENSQPEGGLLVPKTLRIADPDDAARSSIWTTLGLGDGPSSMNAAKAFQMKVDSNATDDDDSTAAKHHQNPAALSRSAAFNENN